MRFKKSHQLPGAGRAWAWHHHGSDTPTSPRAIFLLKSANGGLFYTPLYVANYGQNCAIFCKSWNFMDGYMNYLIMYIGTYLFFKIQNSGLKWIWIYGKISLVLIPHKQRILFIWTVKLGIKKKKIWEGHKILRNLHLTFVLCSASQK